MPISDPNGVRVLHVAETIRGGIATYFNELHPHQAKSFGAANVHYVIPSDHRKDIGAIDDAAISGFTRTGRNLASLWRMATTTLRAVRQFKPDVVHLHSTLAGLVLRPLLLLYRSRLRVVYCPHGWSFARECSAPEFFVTRFAEQLLALSSDSIICISASEYNSARSARIAAARLVLVQSGINRARTVAPTAAPWETERLKVVFVGRLDQQKGYDMLIEAARELTGSIDLRLVGSAVVDGERKLDLPANVTPLGWLDRPAIEAQLDQADIVIIPSRWEAFGLVALEAMRAAKPIVAFRVGALPEIIIDGKTGILCEPVGTQALIQGLRTIAQLDLPAVGSAARARFLESFTIERTHAALSKVYMGLMMAPGQRAMAEPIPDLSPR